MSVLWLDAIGTDDATRVGGKAFALARAKRAGLPVPDGFVWSGGAVDEAGRSALGRAYARLGGSVAVRSSSTAEDLAAASFAGQYETRLDVSGADAVVTAIESVLGSAAAGTAYADAVGAQADGSMAVLVQRFVEPRIAGVAFTRHPQDSSSVLVEAHAGRGDALVSGAVTPERYVVARDGGRAEAPAGVGLAPHECAAVVALALRAEQLFGAAQDVEWAWGREGLVLLQSRPITVAADDRPQPRRLTRANVGEVLPDPVTPLTWTTLAAFLEAAFRELSQSGGLLPRRVAGEPFLALHHERLYLNLDLCLEVAGSIPGIEPADAERLVLGGGATGGRLARLSPAALPRLIATGVGLLRLGARLPQAVAAVQDEQQHLPGRDAIASAEPARLAAWLESFAACGRRAAFAHVGTSGVSAVRLALLGRLLAAVAPGDANARVNRLMAALDDVESAAPTAVLEATARDASGHPEWAAWLALPPAQAVAAWRAGRAPADLAQRLSAFLARFGHRALSEGELRAETWEDDPTPVVAGLQSLVAEPAAADLRRRARADLRRADEEALLARLSPWWRAALAWALTAARDGVRARERTKSMAVATMHHGRHLVRAAAARLVAAGALAQPDDVFFLTLGELVAALRGARPHAAVVARRRRRFERAASLPAPRDVDRSQPEAQAGVAPGVVLSGIGVSGGSAIGPARVVSGDGPVSLVPGDVLITPVLDAALGPLLTTAAAAVAEIGGMLSHGSVVARELGVPCVVDVRDATRRIANGERVWVDGSTGRVVRLADSGARGMIPETPAAFLDAAGSETRGPHALADHRLARESVYFNAQDPGRGLRLVASLGVRRGGAGEALVAVSLPDGRTLFGLELAAACLRPEALSVAGVSAGWEPATLRFDGRLAAHESAGFPPAPVPLLLTPRTVPVILDLRFSPTTPAIDFCAGLPAAALAALEPLGGHHVEQSGRWTGTLTIDGRTLPFDGTGSRDQSWGLRDWNAADHWRLVTVRFGDDAAIHALAVNVNGARIEGGFVWRSGRAERITRIEHVALRSGPRVTGVELEVSTVAGPPVRLRGTVQATVSVPVQLERRLGRHLAGRPYGLVLHENFTRFETSDGRVGHGMAEITERPLAPRT